MWWFGRVTREERLPAYDLTNYTISFLCLTFLLRKIIMPNIDFYWNIYKTLTHNALFNLILSIRGNGKTYGVKKRCIENFIKKREQFAYVRRYKDDIPESLSEFWKDVGKEFGDYEYKVEGKKIYIRLKPTDEKEKWTKDDIAGYAFHLSTATNKKSVPYPFITTIMFDEFLMEEGNQRYLPNEVRAFLNLYETIARPGTDHPRVIAFLLANTITITNPYFLYWDLKMPTNTDKNGKRIWKHPTKSILVEDATTDAFTEAKRTTEFGEIVKGTDYEGYSVENKFLLDNDTFVEKRTPRARIAFNFNYKGEKFGVWYDYTEGKMWVSDATDPYGIEYSFTVKDHTPNTMLFKTKNKSHWLKNFFDSFKNGCLYFESIKIKNMTFEVFKISYL